MNSIIKNLMKTLIHLHDLVLKLLYTLALVFIFKIGLSVTLPGVDPLIWESLNRSTHRISFFALYLSPYLIVNVLILVLSSMSESFQRWRKEKPARTFKYIQISILVFSLFQALWYLSLVLQENLISDFRLIQYNLNIKQDYFFFYIHSILFFTLGTTVLQWFAHLITKKGLGNGISIVLLMAISIESSPYLLETDFIQNLLLFKERTIIIIVFIFSHLCILTYLLFQEKTKLTSFLPLSNLWSNYHLKDYHSKKIAEVGGGKAKLYLSSFTLQSISFMALILSNLFYLLFNSSLHELISRSIWMKFCLELYCIWISVIFVVWFFCIHSQGFVKEYAQRALLNPSLFFQNLSSREFTSWVWIQSYKEIKQLFIYLSVLKLGPYILFDILQMFLIYIDVLPMDSIDLNLFEFRNKLGFVFLFAIRLFYSIGKQLQNKLWWNILNRQK